MTSEHWKLGTFEPDRGWVPVQLDHVYTRERQRNVDRIAAAPRSGHIDLIARLVAAVPGPFRFVYCLLDGSDELPGGYYTVVRDLGGDEVCALLTDFREFFEVDGRHSLWITSPREKATLIFDEHNLVYAYGPLDTFEEVLKGVGLQPGEVEVPFPHSHHRHERLESELQRLMTRETWSFRGPFA